MTKACEFLIEFGSGAELNVEFGATSADFGAVEFSADGDFPATLEAKYAEFDLRMEDQSAEFDAGIEGLQLVEVSELPPYDGAYVVDPLIKAPVILPTKGKNMMDNVTVKKMRQLEVGNGAGGNTLIIGEEL